MRLRLTILFLFVTCLLFGQRGRFFTSTIDTTPPPAQNDTTIEFIWVTSPTHHVARSGIEHLGTISAPTNHTITWAVKRHTHSRTTVANGSGTDFSHTFTFIRMDSCMIYDLEVTATRGIGFEIKRRRFFGAFTVLPQVPTVFDIQWNTSGSKQGTWATDMSGKAARISGSLTGLNLFWWNAADPANPFHIVADAATITNSANQCLKMTAFKNTIIDGATDEEVPYGLVLSKNASGTGILYEFQACEPNDADKVSRNVVIVGIKMDGGASPSTGVTGARIVTTQSVEATNKEGTYAMRTFVMSDFRIDRTFEEGLYGGQSNHALVGGNAFSHFEECYFYNFSIENCGNEGIQMAQFDDSEIFDFSVINPGTRNQGSHRNAIQMGDGSNNFAIFGGTIETAHNSLLMGTGRIGDNYEFFSNVITSTGRDEDGAGTNGFITLLNSEVSGVYMGVFNNTWKVSSGDMFTMYNNTSVNYDKFYVVANLFINNTGDEYEIGSGSAAWDLPNEVVFNNLITTDISDFGFVDAVNKNYRPSTTSTLPWGAYTSFTKLSPWANYDNEGYEYINGIAGAYSGVSTITANE